MTGTGTSPLVSVVVPIYKVEKHLRQCVESILAQTLTDIEVILVDDGSPDACPQMVDEFAAKDPRVVAIHQPNGGYGRAVNHGIERARGEYIGIIESDDWIEPDMYEALHAKAKEQDADLVKCGFYSYDSTQAPGKQDVKYRTGRYDVEHMPQGAFDLLSYPQILLYHASLWATLYRADFLKGQKVIESSSASYQDFPFMIEALCRAKRIAAVPRYLLHYRMEEGQGSSTMTTGQRLLMMPTQCMEGKRLLKQYDRYEQLKEEFYHHAWLTCIGFFRQIDREYRDEYYRRMQELFCELKQDAGFAYTYFRSADRKACKLIVQGSLLHRQRVLWLNWKTLKRNLFALKIGRKGFCFQLLGLLIATPRYQNRPALWRICLR